MRFRVELQKTVTATVLVETRGTDMDAFDEARFIADRDNKWIPTLSGSGGHVSEPLSDDEWLKAKDEEKIREEEAAAELANPAF